MQRRRARVLREFLDRMGEKPTAIILFAHGSGVPEANRQVVRLAEEISRGTHCTVGCAFLEVAQPDLPAAVAGAAGTGARRIVVIPYFLTTGVHIHNDLPRLIEQQRTLFPGVEFLIGRSLEGHPGMAELIVNRVREVLPEGSEL